MFLLQRSTTLEQFKCWCQNRANSNSIQKSIQNQKESSRKLHKFLIFASTLNIIRCFYCNFFFYMNVIRLFILELFCRKYKNQLLATHFTLLKKFKMKMKWRSAKNYLPQCTTTATKSYSWSWSWASFAYKRKEHETGWYLHIAV